MKNFRKVLALVLVVATLFSFVAMTASAKEYTDTDKVSYTEAVDVLSAIGILNGYPDGTFRPTNTIARAEMAKMVAVLSNAGDDIADLYAGACKFADMTGDAVWAKSYVAYCNQMGIVAGRNATTFDPYGKVTGIETAKMLLCLIGFDAKAQGYVGTNWQTHVLADAKNMGLLSGFAADYNPQKAITREEAAQMMLNALQAPMVVGTVSDSIVNITNNAWLVQIGKDGKFDLTLADAQKKYDCWVLYGNVVVSPIKVYTNYKYLDVNYDSADCYMNPVTEWTYKNAKGTVVWSAQYAQTPDFSDTKAVDFKTLLKEETAFTGSATDKFPAYTMYVYEDGFKLANDAFYGVKLNALTSANWDTLAALTGKGVLTNVFVDDAARTVIVTIKNTYIDVVENTTKASNMFTLSHYSNYNPNNASHGQNAFSNKNYGFETGDVILYWICNDGLHDAKLAEPVTATATRATTVGGDPAQSTVVAGGKTYEYAKNFEQKIASLVGESKGVMGARGFDYSAEYDLYLDEYGYIMYWAKVVNGKDYKYAYAVENTGRKSNQWFDGQGAEHWDYTATLVGMDGTLTEKVAVDANVYSEVVWTTTDREKTGRLLRYYNDNDVATMSGTTSGVDVAQRATNGSYLSKAGDLYDANGNVIVYNTDKTQYLVRTWDYTKGEYVYTPFNGKDGLDRSYADHTYVDTGVSRTYSTIQYFVEDATDIGSGNGGLGTATRHDVLTYVFIDAVYEVNPVNAFVLGYKMSVSDVNFSGLWGAYDAYEAYVGGVKGLLMLTDNQASKIVKNGTAGWLYQVNLATIGYSEEAGLPVYAFLDDADVTPTQEHEEYRYDVELGRLFVDNDPIPYTFAEDAIIVAAVPDADGNKTLEELTPEELNDYVENLYNTGAIDPSSKLYVTVHGWMVKDGKTVNELYIDYTTVTAGSVNP